MGCGSTNTPGAWLVEMKNQLKEILARVRSVEKTLGGAEKIPGTSAPTAQVTAQVGQIYINVTSGEEWKCVSADAGGTVWEKQEGSTVGLTAADVGASPIGHKHTRSEITDFPASMPASDVAAWAKAAAKPAYTAAEVGAKASTWKPYHVGTSAPTDTTQLWIDTTASTGGLKYHNGTAWVHVPVAYT